MCTNTARSTPPPRTLLQLPVGSRQCCALVLHEGTHVTAVGWPGGGRALHATATSRSRECCTLLLKRDTDKDTRLAAAA